jgi:hypothetical protein
MPYVRSSLISEEYDGAGNYNLVYLLVDTDGVLPPSAEQVTHSSGPQVTVGGASPSLMRAISKYGSLAAVAAHAEELGFSAGDIAVAAAVSGQSTTPGAWTPYKAPSAKDVPIDLNQFSKVTVREPDLTIYSDEELAAMAKGADIPWFGGGGISATPVIPQPVATPKLPTPGLQWGDVASTPRKPGAYANPAVASVVGEIMGEMAQKTAQQTTVMATNALPGYRPIKLRPRTR